MRDRCIDMAKGLAIMMVVFNHSGIAWQPAKCLLSVIALPLFFFLSGYCFKEKYLEDTKTFVLRKIKGIYFPFVKWSLLFLILLNACTSKNLIAVFWHMKEPIELLGGFWFLRELFWGILCFYFLLKITKRPWIVAIESLALAVGMYYGYSSINRILHLQRWFYFNHYDYWMFYASAFITMGYQWRLLKDKLPKDTIGYPLVGLVLLGIGVWVNMQHRSFAYQPPLWMVPYLITSLGATSLVLWCCEKIQHISWIQKSLSYVGEHTLTILALHFSVFRLITWLIYTIGGVALPNEWPFPVDSAYASMGWFVLYAVTGITIPLLVERIIDKLSKIFA